MLQPELQSFLNQHHIEYQCKKTEESPFVFLYCPRFGLIIHCIEIAIFQKSTLSNVFFQELSIGHNSQETKIIHVWEDVWAAKNALIKSRLLALFGISERIHARLCKIKKIDQPTLNNFLLANHLQGTTKAKYKYGLYVSAQRFTTKNDTEMGAEYLVAVASFGSLRPMPSRGEKYLSAELIRFANLQGYTVVGGLDKLLKAFEREHQPNDMMTYADTDWSNGQTYQKLGFAVEGHTPPHFFWLDTLLNQRVRVQKTTEHEPSEKLLIWNSGSLKCIKTF